MIEEITKLEERLKKQHPNGYTVQDAECLAEEVLKIYGWKETSGPVPIVKIAECFDIKVYTDSDMPEDMVGNIYIGGNTEQIYGNKKVIVVAENDDYFHQRFIAAHQLGHYLMDYLGNTLYKDKEILFSKVYPKIVSNGNYDTQADRFAEELLMPYQVFCKQYHRVMEAAMNDKRYAIPYLSKYFEMEKKMIKKRIMETIKHCL